MNTWDWDHIEKRKKKKKTKIGNPREETKVAEERKRKYDFNVS